MPRPKKKPKIDKNPDIEKFDYIKTVKDKADGVIKKEHLIHINNMAILINKFVIHAYMFIKLYFLFLYKHKLVLPKITEDFIKNGLKNIYSKLFFFCKYMVLISEITKLKELGKGMTGTVYLCEDMFSNKYAMKIQQILKKDIKEKVFREKDFAETMSSKYPEHFMTLYDNKIDETCKHKQSWSGMHFKMKDLPKEQQTYYTKLFASPYCSISVWSLIDMTLDEYINSSQFKKEHFRDLLIQVMYVIFLIQKEGYFHTDLHFHNIGLVKTKKKTINVLGKDIPTHGYLVQAIDYELILHKKYKLKVWEEIRLKNDNDVFVIITCLFNDQLKQFHEIVLTDVDIDILSGLLPKRLTDENKNYFLRILYRLLFWNKWQSNLKEQKEPILLVPIDVILFMIKNIYNTNKIIEYL
jgi:hypothetical protein